MLTPKELLQQGFTVRPCVIAGENCHLVFPDSIMAVSWTEENKKYRSAIINSENEIISMGFRKFMNWGEKPDFEPFDVNQKISFVRKIDGSLLIVSRYKGEWIIRTRGTVSAFDHETGAELPELMKKYHRFFRAIEEDPYSTSSHSYLFEWTTPNNIIVVPETSEPDLCLIGIVKNSTGTYVSQWVLDTFAQSYGLRRPEVYSYESVEECLKDVEQWPKYEGIVMYSEDGQILKKVKAEMYKIRHRMRSNFSSYKNLVEFYFQIGKPLDVQDFSKAIEDIMDYEVASIVYNSLYEIVNHYQLIQRTMLECESLVDSVMHLSRKEMATVFMEKYGKSPAFNWCWSFVDKKPIKDESIMKMMIDKVPPYTLI
jgi:hypothetical protein